MSTAYVTIVTGLPRSGTRMMIDAITAGGMPAAALPMDSREAAWQMCVDKAVRVPSIKLPDLPESVSLRVILMRRNVNAIVEAQMASIARRQDGRPVLHIDRLRARYDKCLTHMLDELAERRNIHEVLEVSHDALRRCPGAVLGQVNMFLDRRLNVSAMCEQAGRHELDSSHGGAEAEAGAHAPVAIAPSSHSGFLQVLGSSTCSGGL